MSRRPTLNHRKSASIRYRVFIVFIDDTPRAFETTKQNLFSHVSRGQARIKPSMTQLPFRSRHHNLSRFNFYPSHTCFSAVWIVSGFPLECISSLSTLLYLKSLLPLHITYTLHPHHMPVGNSFFPPVRKDDHQLFFGSFL